jgi:cobalt-zinc-cadmium efflux system protein
VAEHTHAGDAGHADHAHAGDGHGHGGHGHAGHGHAGHAHFHSARDADRRALKTALALIVSFMAAEVVAGILASSLALLSDAAHMLTDAAALALSLAAAKLVERPARGAMTYGMGRAEILSAQANGVTLLVLAFVIVYDAIRRIASAPHVHGTVVLVTALVGIAVNLLAARVLAGGSRDGERSLNVEGSYRHILTDLYGFLMTAVAAIVIMATGFARADAIASIVIAGLMLHAAFGLLIASGRVFMEAAPAGLDPHEIGHALAHHPGVVEVHDLHVWEVTSGFPALSAHVVTVAGGDCHELRHELQDVLRERFEIEHTTIQVDHEAAAQAPLQIEVSRGVRQHLDSES